MRNTPVSSIRMHKRILSVMPKRLKLALIPAWLGGSFLFLFAVTSLLSSKPMYTYEPNVLGARDEDTYSLFTALPRRGSTLTQSVSYSDTRAYKLHAFFDFYGAPNGMIDAVPDFIAAADEYDLPWTLLPAIACKESGCGRIIPTGSNNPFGWAVYTGQNSGANFDSFGAAAWRVAQGLRNDYFNKGLDTVGEIETKYTPPSAATHNHWRDDVTYFMGRIEGWSL